MEKKNRIRAGFIFGIIMALFFIVRALLIHHLILNGLIRLIGISVFSGAISGVVFGLLIGLFSKAKFSGESTRFETAPDENILFETPANHMEGKEEVGGKLYLTNRRLIFKSHKLKLQNQALLINLADIKNVEKYTSVETGNGLTLTTTLGDTEWFVVEQADKWMKYLTEEHSF